MTLPKTIRGLRAFLPEDIERHEALTWYQEASDYAKDCARLTGHSYETVCAVIAVLSPAVSWPINKRDALDMLSASDPASVTVSTYGANKAKAIRLMNGGTIAANVRGRKARSFFFNILDPDCCDNVTIDRHAIRAAYGLKGLTIKPDDIPVIASDKRYNHFKTLYKRLAAEKGLTPNQLQAIIWIEFKQRQEEA